jgi:hypothetical protein
MKTNSKKGSLLIENLLALLYVTIVLLPFSHLYVKIFKTNILLEEKENEAVLRENILEYLENTEYQNIEAKTGNRYFNSLKDFCSFFSFKCKEIKKSENFHINIDIQKTNYYYLNKNSKKLFIFRIAADNRYFYYMPDLEDYEK